MIYVMLRILIPFSPNKDFLEVKPKPTPIFKLEEIIMYRYYLL